MFWRLGLIGYPLGHSRSPDIHAAALNALGLAGEYRLYPVLPLPEGTGVLSELLMQMRAAEIQGLNVTIPHKGSVAPFLDDMAPDAATIGAVNTILFRDGHLVGDNTDARGFLADLELLAPDLLTSSPKPRSALVLGAGGSARAIVWALLNAGWQVTLAARRMEQVQGLMESYLSSVISDRLSVISYQTIGIDNQQSAIINHQSSLSLIVNCTPLGMSPNIDTSPWPASVPLPKEAVVYDLVYNPSETLLVRRARQAGLRAFTGLGMLVEQAGCAFELWTGLPAPREVMREAVRQV